MLPRAILLLGALGPFGALAQCLLPGNMTFDYVVIGGGTAGMTVASRLSEDPDVNVLVLEAGADKSSDPFVTIPGLFSSQVNNPDYDWIFHSTKQVYLATNSYRYRSR